MAGLFLNSAFQILTQAVREWREEKAHAHAH
jgi:hypothetical protein